VRIAAQLLCLAALASQAAWSQKNALSVCADPDNLPFSDRAGEGFENEIVQLVARDMGAKVKYVWWAQRRGYVRNTLNQARCDVWPGVAHGVETLATTSPYYRSTYVFVSRKSAPMGGLTLDDARLKTASIGVQMVGNGGAVTPPAHAMASRGIIDNVRGFMLYGNTARPNAPATIVDAVAQGEIDVGLVWGPLAGYFASRSKVPLRIEAVTPAAENPWPMVYEVAMGVRKGDSALLARLDSSLDRERSAISRILRRYHVPQIP
jgi:mxaJ protein